ncbi:MAG: nuclear transport factor 2 family protein [Gemmatimonadales bacterium]|nr:nuclear transport factor 2 family protein [Gemmatimonadales bacterium]
MGATSTDEPRDTGALGRSIVDSFGKGWAKQDIDLLVSVFLDDAVFLETPFAPPRKGLDAIREYWRDVGYHQSEGRFSSGEVFAIGPWFSTEFKFVFRRRRTGEWVDVRGALFCETSRGKVAEMRMYWHRWAEGREIRQE